MFIEWLVVCPRITWSVGSLAAPLLLLLEFILCLDAGGRNDGGPLRSDQIRSDQIGLSLPSPPRLGVWYGYCAHASDAEGFDADRGGSRKNL